MMPILMLLPRYVAVPPLHPGCLRSAASRVSCNPPVGASGDVHRFLRFSENLHQRVVEDLMEGAVDCVLSATMASQRPAPCRKGGTLRERVTVGEFHRGPSAIPLSRCHWNFCPRPASWERASLRTSAGRG